jgi:hypothetical protein
MTRVRHPNKEIEAAARYADEHGFECLHSRRSSHA